jgi:hypothetical protein
MSEPEIVQEWIDPPISGVIGGLYLDNEPWEKSMANNRVTQAEIDQLLDSADTEQAILHGRMLVVDYQLPSRGGFAVTGRAAVVDPANFNLEIGRKICRDDAANQLWQLEGYLKQLELAGLIRWTEA